MLLYHYLLFFFFSSRRRHTRCGRDWSSDVCSSDLECFSKTHTDVFTFNCTITKAYWEQKDDRLIFYISAKRFLRNMVRAIVGTLIYMGSGKITVEDVRKIIESKDRGKAGFSVPAHGLYLTRVVYPYINETN